MNRAIGKVFLGFSTSPASVLTLSQKFRFQNRVLRYRFQSVFIDLSPGFPHRWGLILGMAINVIKMKGKMDNRARTTATYPTMVRPM